MKKTLNVLTIITMMVVIMAIAIGAENNKYSYNYSENILTLESGTCNTQILSDVLSSLNVRGEEIRVLICHEEVMFYGDCSQMFMGWNNCIEMTILYVDTSGVTNMDTVRPALWIDLRS